MLRSSFNKFLIYMLEDKLSAFLAREPIEAMDISNEGLKANSSTVLGSSGLIFETGVRLLSEFIPNPSLPSSFWGAHSYINPGGYYRGGVFVGRYCSIGRRVSLGSGTHHLDWPSSSASINFQKGRPYSKEESSVINFGAERNPYCVIGSDVWIGDGAVIMPGLTIGVGAVVGANSVVTRDIEPFTVVAGAPAKKLRLRFNEKIIYKLIESSWWNYEKQVIDRIATRNIFEFLERIQELRGSNVSFYNFDSYQKI